MTINCLIFDNITSLDAIGATTVFARTPNMQINYIGLKKGLIRSSQSKLGMIVDYDLEDAPDCDILLIPGGPGIREILEDKALISYVQNIHKSSKLICSVCTGSLLLGQAGLLKGKEATTHWNALNDLKKYGAIPISKRIIENDKLIMAAGVSAGIDMALTLVSKFKGEKIARALQLKIEYDPAPPFDGGSIHKEIDEIIELAKRKS